MATQSITASTPFLADNEDIVTKSTFKGLALPMAAMDIPVIRLQHKSKLPMDSAWQNLATTDSKDLGLGLRNTECELRLCGQD